MAEQFKFSINIKPRVLDELRGTGIVAGQHYPAYCADAGFAYLEKVGIPLRPNPIAVSLRWDVALISPLGIGEELKISARITRIGRSSWAMEYQLNEASTGRPVATIYDTGVLMDLETGRSTPWLEEDKQKVIAFEGKENVEVAER